MVINIRGTGGSGKSTLVRRLMAHATMLPEFVIGRKRPIAYSDRAVGLYVPGHYETPCGGCDTLAGPDAAYELVRAAAAQGMHVVFEGIIVQDDVRRCIELSREYPVLVIGLQVPVEACLDAIRERRAARGDARALNPTNTVHRAKRLDGIMTKLVAAGVEAKWLSREAAYVECCARLGLTGGMLVQQTRGHQLALGF